MDKVATFIDKNRVWFSWGSVAAILGLAVWIIQSMNSINTTISILNTNFTNFSEKYDTRATLVDDRINDHEYRLRDLEKLIK